MTYSKDTKNIVLKSLLEGKTPKEISEGAGAPCLSTIYRWRNEAGLKLLEKIVLEALPKVQNSARKNWAKKDYSDEQKKDWEKKKEILNKKWGDIRGYKPNNIEYIESVAREKYHGETLEDKEHLEIYQLNGSARTKKIGPQDSELKLTAQDHIFPHSHIPMELRGESYNPINVREGNAAINGFIRDCIDPVFKKGEKTISHETAEMLNKYNLKEVPPPKGYASFKYWEDRIVTSNMVTKLPQSSGGSFEAPELGILDGPKSIVSMKAYSVPLYKINSSAGIIDIARLPNKQATNNADGIRNKTSANWEKNVAHDSNTSNLSIERKEDTVLATSNKDEITSLLEQFLALTLDKDEIDNLLEEFSTMIIDEDYIIDLLGQFSAMTIQ